MIVVSYLCGNISVSRIISHYKKQDITKLGSGNPGSTNVLRFFGLKLGVLNLILDMLKSFVPAMIFFHCFGQNYIYLYASGLSCILGHNFPVFFKFKGGKGIATMMGLFLAADPIVTLIVLAVGLILWILFEYGAIVSIVCVTSFTIIEGIRVQSMLPPAVSQIICLLLFAIFLITWYSHRANISRLLLGKENKASLIKKVRKKLKSKGV